MICVTEPRRIAAINLAKRMSEEKSIIMGQEVSYILETNRLYQLKIEIIK